MEKSQSMDDSHACNYSVIHLTGIWSAKTSNQIGIIESVAWESHGPFWGLSYNIFAFTGQVFVYLFPAIISRNF